MYSLSEATELLIDNYSKKTNKEKDILRYNTHKIRHSNGVLEIGRLLLIKIQENIIINQELINKAEICFLLHDLGRFHQNNRIRILTNEEFEHGDSSYEIAKERGYSNEILLAIKYHNKYSINELYNENDFKEMIYSEKEETIFLTKITRDADKLQNMLYLLVNLNGLTRLNNKLIDGDINYDVLEDIKNKNLVDRKNIISKADDIVSILGWLNDINFKESLKILDFYNFKEKLINQISEMKEVKIENIKILKDNL